jgi:hypothetical protein
MPSEEALRLADEIEKKIWIGNQAVIFADFKMLRLLVGIDSNPSQTTSGPTMESYLTGDFVGDEEFARITGERD